MVLRRVIADSSSIILLQKVDLLGIFLHHYQVVVPDHVYDELTCKHKKGSSELQHLLSANIVKTSDNIVVRGMGRGESSVIRLYFDGVGDFVLIDDKKGANYCKAYGIPFVNSLLVSRILRLAGVISENTRRAAAQQLIENGYYSAGIIRKAAAIRDIDLQQFLPLSAGGNDIFR